MTDDETPERAGNVPLQPRLLTILDVMREPIVSYEVSLAGDRGAAEEWWPFDDEAEAIDVARALDSSGRKDVAVKRRVLRVVEELTVLDWRSGPA